MDKTKEPLTDNELFHIYQDDTKDENEKLAARNELIIRQSDTVEKAAWKHFKWRNACGIEDLIQESWRGVMKAVDKFDPSFGVPFQYYAYQWAEAMVRYAIYSKGRTIRTPIPKIRALAQIKASMSVLKEDLGREPSELEISAVTGITIKQLRKILSSEVHLFSTTMASKNQGGENVTGDFRASVTSPAQACEKNENSVILRKLIKSQLNANEQMILINRMGLFGMRKKTLNELSIETGYTKPGVRMVEHRAIGKLKLGFNRFEEGMITLV